MRPTAQLRPICAKKVPVFLTTCCLRTASAAIAAQSHNASNSASSQGVLRDDGESGIRKIGSRRATAGILFEISSCLADVWGPLQPGAARSQIFSAAFLNEPKLRMVLFKAKSTITAAFPNVLSVISGTTTSASQSRTARASSDFGVRVPIHLAGCRTICDDQGVIGSNAPRWNRNVSS